MLEFIIFFKKWEENEEGKKRKDDQKTDELDKVDNFPPKACHARGFFLLSVLQSIPYFAHFLSINFF